MKGIISILFCVLFSLAAFAQNNNCANAISLCASNTISSSTIGATTVGSDPPLSCGDLIVNNSVWFTVLAINNGLATVTITNIDNNPGLDVQVYTGNCGSLVSTGSCGSANGPGGTINLNFATVAGTTYYIMVDGKAGNQEAFNITVTTANDAIIAKPDAQFNTNPTSGCVPLSEQLQNTTTLHGGTNITYQWRIDGGPFIPASGSDTTIILNTNIVHSIDLRVCNAECGCKTVNQSVSVNRLDASFSYSPLINCLNSPVDFFGDAKMQPDTTVPPNITSWTWNFGDPNSGASNTDNSQFPTHSFVGPGNSFTVRLIADGDCGPDTVSQVINFNPQPVVYAGPDQSICEGTTATLIATIISAALPIQSYNWIGPGTINCTGCDTTTVDNLTAGGPYLFSLDIVDANGCTADTTVNITVFAKPVVDPGTDQNTCANQPVNLAATPISGNPPFTFAWTPAAGLNDSTLQNPIATVNTFTSFCVTMTDFTGCTSDAACVNVDIYPPPAITPTTAVLCSSNPNLTDTFDVVGAGAGSTYSWVLSPSYGLITGATVDSSSIYVTFPPGVPGNYTFTVIVADGVTGCTDTVSTTFSITNGLNMFVTGPAQICNGDIATLVAHGALTYAWTANPAYPFTDSTQASQDVSPAVTTVFSIYGVAGTCSKTITYTLTVNPLPVAVAGAIADFCGCATVSLNGTGSTPGMSYLWASLGGAAIANPNALSTTSSLCGPESFFLTVTDPASGCLASDFTSANELPNPDAIVDVSPNLICPGIATVVTLDGSASNSAGGTTYLWTSNDPSVIIVAPTSQSTTATVSQATVFYLTVTDIAGCDSIASDTVFIYPPPLFTATPAFLCTADPSHVSTLSITGAGAGSTYSWYIVPACAVPNTANTASQVFDFTTCGVGAFNFSVSVTDGVNSCVDTVTRTVTVVNGVALVVSNDTSICQGSSVTVSASGANSYVWNTGALTPSVTFNNLTPAGSPYKFIVTGRIGSCTAVDSVIVTVNPVPVTSPITGSDTVCENDLGVAYSVTPAIGNYTWTVNGGIISSGQGTDVISVDWGAPGTGTVSVIDTNGFGCAGTLQTLSVTINPLPVTPPINGQDTVCENSTTSYFVIPNAGSVYNWAVAGGIITGSSTGNIISVLWGPAGPGFISVQETNAVGCFSSGQSLVTEINPQPLPLIVNGNTALCEGDTMQTYSTPATPGSTYSWSVTGGSLISGQGTDIVLVNWGSAGTGIVYCTEINSFGCSSETDSLVVTLTVQPIATALPDSAIVCLGTTFPISGTATPGTITWTTTGAGTFNNANIASPVYTPDPADSGYYTLTMVLSNPPCLDDTAIVVIYVTFNPTVTVSVTQDTICSGTADTLTATGGGTYLWNPGGDTNAVYIANPMNTGYYSVTVTNGFGCSTKDSLLITAIPIPNTSPIAGPDSVCEHDSLVVYSVTPQAGNYFWTISGGTITAGLGTDSIYVQWDTAGVAGTITVVDTNAAGCAGPLRTLTITINPLPVTSIITGPDTVCQNSTTSHSVTSTAGTTYNWIVGGGTIQGSATGNIVSITWNISGTGSISVSETNASGCTSIAQDTTIVIHPAPLPAMVLGNDTLCEGDSLQVYSTPATVGSTYAWTVLGGTLTSGQNTDSIHVNWGAPGNGSVIVLETNLFGCISDSTIFNVLLNAHPVASGYPDSVTVCQSDSLPVSGSVNAGFIQWTTSGTGTFDDSTLASPVYATGLTDTGYVSLTIVVSNPPCENDTDVVVVYIAPRPSVTLSATQTAVCAGDSSILTATGGGSYLWNPGGDTTSTITIHPVINNTYSVIVTNGFGCNTADSIVITVIPHGIPTASGDTLICIGDSAHLSGTFLNAGGLQWSTLGDGIFLPDTNSINVTYAPGPNDSISGGVDIVLVTTGACFNETDTLHVSINQFPGAFAGDDVTITTDANNTSPIQLNGSVTNASGGFWTHTGSGVFSPDSTYLNAVYTASVADFSLDSIILTLTTYGGCRVATDYLVINFELFSIPNVITPYPNSPGFNDFFRINNLPPNSKLRIWDRWGALVYTSDYYLNDWDGAELKADTYYYALLTTTKEYHGWIKLIRGE